MARSCSVTWLASWEVDDTNTCLPLKQTSHWEVDDTNTCLHLKQTSHWEVDDTDTYLPLKQTSHWEAADTYTVDSSQILTKHSATSLELLSGAISAINSHKV